MLSGERQMMIQNCIEKKRSVLVSELANEYHVSMETIRRDLRQLSRKGLVRQVHGGAVIIDKAPGRYDLDMNLRRNQNYQERQKIIQCAASLLHENDTIALNNGVTCEEFAKVLPDHYNLRVFTVSIPVAYILSERIHSGSFSGRVHIIGGYIDSFDKRVHNEDAFEFLNSLHFDKAFFSATAVDSHGAMQGTTSVGYTSKLLVEHSSKSILMCTSSVFGYTSLYRFCSISDLSHIVTDHTHDIPTDIVSEIKSGKTELEICE